MTDKQKKILREYYLARFTQKTAKGLRLIQVGKSAWVEITSKDYRDYGLKGNKHRFSDLERFANSLNERSKREGRI